MSPFLEKTAIGPLPLLRLIWRSYLTSALVPVFFIELALVAAYLLTNSFIRDQNIASLQLLATEQLRHTSHQQAEQISLQLAAVAHNTLLLRHHAESAFVKPFVPDEAERSRYALTPGGVLHTTRNLPGRSAVHYSRLTHIGEAERAKALRFFELDPLLASLVDTNPLVVQSYVHTADRMLRIYPYRDVTQQFDEDYDFTTYNFYYEADAVHNPDRKVVWTGVYIDPAGLGWMASAIAPLYPNGGDLMEGSVGLDITVDIFIEQVLRLHLPWSGYGVLVDKSGTVLALPPHGQDDWMPTQRGHDSIQKPSQDGILTSGNFSLLEREDSRALGERMRAEQQGRARWF